MKINQPYTEIQRVFVAARVNGAIDYGSFLPPCAHNGITLPHGTWFQQELERVRHGVQVSPDNEPEPEGFGKCVFCGEVTDLWTVAGWTCGACYDERHPETPASEDEDEDIEYDWDGKKLWP